MPHSGQPCDDLRLALGSLSGCVAADAAASAMRTGADGADGANGSFPSPSYGHPDGHWSHPALESANGPVEVAGTGILNDSGRVDGILFLLSSPGEIADQTHGR